MTFSSPTHWCEPHGRKTDAGYLVAQVYFDTRTSTLSPKAQQALSRLRALIDGDKSAQVHIAGHADYRGSDGFNNALARERAEAVARYVRQLEGDWWITIVSRGEKTAVQPQSGAPRPDGDEVAADRRVDVLSPDAIGRQHDFEEEQIRGRRQIALKVENYTRTPPGVEGGLYDASGKEVPKGMKNRGIGGTGAIRKYHKSLINDAALDEVERKVAKYMPSIRAEFVNREAEGLDRRHGALVVVATRSDRSGRVRYAAPIRASRLGKGAGIQKFFATKEAAFLAYWESRNNYISNLGHGQGTVYQCRWYTLAD